MLVSREALTLARELVDEMLEADQASWRRRWLAAMASVRTVYDVLKDVDKQNPCLRAHVGPVLAKHVDGKAKQPAILFGFIKDVANGVLHHLRFDVDAEHRTPVLVSATGGVLTGASGGGAPLTTKSVKFTITTGPLKGQDGRVLLLEACRWLDMLLSEIQASLAQDGSISRPALSPTPTRD